MDEGKDRRKTRRRGTRAVDRVCNGVEGSPPRPLQCKVTKRKPPYTRGLSYHSAHQALPRRFQTRQSTAMPVLTPRATFAYCHQAFPQYLLPLSWVRRLFLLVRRIRPLPPLRANAELGDCAVVACMNCSTKSVEQGSLSYVGSP